MGCQAARTMRSTHRPDPAVHDARTTRSTCRPGPDRTGAGRHAPRPGPPCYGRAPRAFSMSAISEISESWARAMPAARFLISSVPADAAAARAMSAPAR